MRRFRVTLAYDGTEYHGWQVQPGLSTIQGVLQQVLEAIEKKPVHVIGSGRTDAGVHALAQVAAFTLDNPIPAANLRKAMNRLLPPDIRVVAVAEAPLHFHPRHDAAAKTYEYRILRAEVCPPFERRYVYHFPYPLDTAAMQAAAALLVGEHDLSAFAAADARDALGESKVRRIFSSSVRQDNHHLLFRVRGSGFLKHSVRRMMGTLIEVGKRNLPPDIIRAFLDNPTGPKAGPAAPPRGLFLLEVEYGGPAC